VARDVSLPEHNPTNEVARELQSNEAPGFDDIYVPGIGVRGALSDDGAEDSDFRSAIGERWARGIEFVRRWAIRSTGNIRRIGPLLAARLTRIDTQAQTTGHHRPKILVHLTNSPGPDLQQVKRSFSNAVQNAHNTLRSIRKTTLALSALLNLSVARLLQRTRSWLPRIAEVASAKLPRAKRHRLIWSPIRASAVRNLRGAQSFLRSSVIAARDRLRTGSHSKGQLHVSTPCKLTTWQRAAAPLSILLVMVVFVIQQILRVVER